MTELELMIRVIEELALLDVPIVFKGAVVLKIATLYKNFNATRETHDIDGDWVDRPPTMGELEALVDTAVKRVDTRLYAKWYRQYTKTTSAGIYVYSVNEKKPIFKLDISIRDNQFTTKYITTINNIQFIGASLPKMFADKVMAISGDKIFRRSKDLFDLYLLSYINGFNNQYSYIIWDQMGRTLGDFDGFINRKEELHHAYDKLHGLVNKPKFEDAYDRVYPFIYNRRNLNLTWDGNNWLEIF